MLKRYKQKKQIFTFFLLLIASSYGIMSYALPFSIVPEAGVAFPTQILSGWTTTAFYTVTNETHEQRVNNYVKHLPPFVAQIVADPNVSFLCGSPFTLSANGVPGDSCTLELLIAGPVDANDPDPHHHLFICFPGGETCAGPTPANSLNIAELTSYGTQALGGFFSNTGGNSPPLLLATRLVNTNTQTFQFITPNNGPGTVNGFYDAASCAGTLGSICAAVGGFGSETPLLSVSSLDGQVWSDIDVTALLPGFATNAFGELVTDFCSGTICVAGGFYINSAHNDAAILLNSSGNLSTWTYFNVSNLLPGGDNSLINGVGCAGNVCAAGGEFGAAFPLNSLLLLASQNGGVSWNLISANALIPNFSAGEFLQTSCTSSVCLATGFYSTTTSGANSFPLVFSSLNNGANWSFTDVTGVIPALVFGSLNASQCDGSVCVVGGNYNNGGSTSNMLPLLLESNTAGQSWNFINLATLLPNLASGPGTIGVSEFACTGSTCIAGGNYFSSTAGQVPFLLISKNNGQSWSFFNILPLSSRLQNSTLVQINSVACTKQTCTAVGVFNDPNNGFATTPLVVMSNNTAATWAFVDVTPDIPAFASGTLNTVGGSS